MKKKGQITIFIIVGIIILLAIAVILSIQSTVISKDVGEAEVAPLLSSSVENYIGTCIQKTGKEALTFVAQQGGYYQLPDLSEFDLPYYLHQNESHIITKEELERQISSYINNELFFCIKNFVPFREAGLDIQQQEVNTSTIISKNKVIFDVTFPVTVKQDTLSKSLARFSEAVPSGIGINYDLAEKFMQQQEKIPTSLCVSCLVELGIESNLRTEMDFITDGIIMFTIIDDNTQLEYKFLNKYEFRK